MSEDERADREAIVACLCVFCVTFLSAIGLGLLWLP